VPPLSPEATWRHYLRQEPDAGKPLVRICAGGYEQSWFLLRLAQLREQTSFQVPREDSAAGEARRAVWFQLGFVSRGPPSGGAGRSAGARVAAQTAQLRAPRACLTLPYEAEADAATRSGTGELARCLLSSG